MTDTLGNRDIDRLLREPSTDDRLATVHRLAAALQSPSLTEGAREQMTVILQRFAEDLEPRVRAAVPEKLVGGRRASRVALGAAGPAMVA